jgi:hypothetical protein
MARRCASCDGILGVDCFNESECLRIEYQQEQDRRRHQEQRIADLEERTREPESTAGEGAPF